MTTGRLWLSVARGATYGLQPRATLRDRLSRRLGRSGRPCHLVTSGRVALMLVARSVAQRTSRRVALVPDYICNVVHTAVDRAGFRAEPYPTDRTCEPDDAWLQARLAGDDVALLVTASVFGSSAWLDRLAGAEVRALIQRTGVHVVVDACQDISLLDHLPDGYGDSLSAIVSFNNKSVPGLMGGAAVTGLPLPAGLPQSLTAAQRSFFRRQLLAHVRARLAGRGLSRSAGESEAFEYSSCKRFPYAFDTAGISKLQVLMALVGLDNLPAFGAAKRELFETCGDAVVAPRLKTAAYVLVSDASVMPHRRRKRPYAAPDAPGSSLRPGQTILHNKGFLDDTRP